MSILFLFQSKTKYFELLANYTFLVRTRSFWLRLTVLIFSVDFRLICSYSVLATTVNKQKLDSGWRKGDHIFSAKVLKSLELPEIIYISIFMESTFRYPCFNPLMVLLPSGHSDIVTILE